MTEFQRFKSKITRDALIRSALLSLGAALVSVGVLLCTLKLLAIALAPLWYVLAGVLVALATFTVVFLILRPTDLRVARLLDRTLGLDERVQTMLAFRGCEGAIYEVQRADAERHLGAIPTGTVKFRRPLSTVLIFVLSAAIFTGSLLVPVSAGVEPQPEVPVGDWERQYLLEELRALASRVGSDSTFIDDGLKKGMLKEINTLIGVVEQKDLMSEMRLAAIDTVVNISAYLAVYNTAPPIARLMAESNTDEIALLGNALLTLKASSVRSAMSALCDRFLSVTDRALEIEYLTEEIDAYLRASGVDAGDDMYMIYKSLTAALTAASSSPTDSAIEAAFSSVEDRLTDELLWQQVNQSTAEYAVAKLYALFSLDDSDFEDIDSDADIVKPGDDILPDEPPVLDDDELSTEGGYSEGGTRYSSSDEIYSPEENKYVKYSEMIATYFGYFEAQRIDGYYEEALKNILVQYYNTLY